MAPAILRPVAVHGKEMACLGLQEGCSGASLAGGSIRQQNFQVKACEETAWRQRLRKKSF
jgi:hypothetical protein